MNTVLDSVAGAIVVFGTTFLGAFVALFAGLVGALATKATTVGTPAGIAVFIGALGVFIAALVTSWPLDPPRCPEP